MLTPSILSPCGPFYAIGNTAAVSLTRCVPQGVQADILLLGCGDVRHLLYTAYSEKGFPSRKLDITCCDVEDAIIARNALFLTLLTAHGQALGPRLCWNLYYHLYLDDDALDALQTHLARLLDVSVSSAAWTASEFGTQFRFGTASTLTATRAVWAAYADAIAHKHSNDYRARFEAARSRSKAYKQDLPGSALLSSVGARAAAPLGALAALDDELRRALDAWWDTGITGTTTRTTTTTDTEALAPNPLFSATLSENHVLAFGSDPLLSYHLAAAKAPLTKRSPLRPPEETPADDGPDGEGARGGEFVETAQFQFSEWTKAFTDRPPDSTVVRFVAADGLALCHTLQHHRHTGASSAHWYRRPLSADPLALDADEYAKASTPTTFDVIDTSNLADYVGALNLVVAASPLLREASSAPWATLYTEALQKTADQGAREQFAELLGGPHTITLATLLGISPVEYWTNATAVASVDDYMQALAASRRSSAQQQPQQQLTGVEWRFAWKFNRHMAGDGDGDAAAQRLKVKDTELVALIHQTYQAMFIAENPLALLSLSKEAQLHAVKKQAYPKYHRGSLVAFIKRLLQMVHVYNADTESVCRQVLDKVASEDAATTMLGSNFTQSLALEMARQGLYTEAWLRDEIRRPATTTTTTKNEKEKENKKEREEEGPFAGWSDIPLYAAVTLSIPASRWKRLYQVSTRTHAGFAVQGSLQGIRKGGGGGGDGMPAWHNLFADVHVSFGQIKIHKTKTSGEGWPPDDDDDDDDDDEVSLEVVDEDKRQWLGESPMIATFHVPSAALQVDPKATRVGLSLQHNPQTAAVFQAELGPYLTLYETDLNDADHVYITRHLPGQHGDPVLGGSLHLHHPEEAPAPSSPSSRREQDGSRTSFTANLHGSGEIATMTGHLAILSDDGKKLLADKAAVHVQQVSPFLFEIRLVGIGTGTGDDDDKDRNRNKNRSAVFPLRFPVPVVKDGSRTRIARTSSYVELLAPLADPATAPMLAADFLLPTVLALATSTSSSSSSTAVQMSKRIEQQPQPQALPVPLNIPHVNLDTLPILDVADKAGLRSFLPNLASWTFSARERTLRDQADPSSGLAPSSSSPSSFAPRLNFKESLFTMFMLASGLQGGQTGLFALNHAQKGSGIHILLFVSALRLDGANASVVLDAAVLPLTRELVSGSSSGGAGGAGGPPPPLETFLLLLRTLECCSITVDDEELRLWKRVLPALVERCRTWSHTSACEYYNNKNKTKTVPLSTEPGEQVLCSCGAGQFPPDFLSLPDWDTAAPFATRLAISPTYAVPFVEDVLPPALGVQQTPFGVPPGGGTTIPAGRRREEETTTTPTPPPRCRNCGTTEGKGSKGAALKKCMRCLAVRYCSAECQKRDWKKHRMECEESGQNQK